MHYFQQGGVRPVILPAEVLLKGNNEVQITLLGQTEAAADALAKAVHFYDAIDSITTKAEWSFAKWEPPSAAKLGKGGAKHKAAEPCWWKCELTVGSGSEGESEGNGPVVIDCAGLTKGQGPSPDGEVSCPVLCDNPTAGATPLGLQVST